MCHLFWSILDCAKSEAYPQRQLPSSSCEAPNLVLGPMPAVADHFCRHCTACSMQDAQGTPSSLRCESSMLPRTFSL